MKFGRPILLFGGVYILIFQIFYKQIYKANLLIKQMKIESFPNYQTSFYLTLQICNLSQYKSLLNLTYYLKMDWKNKPNQIFNKVKNQMFAKGVENFYALDEFIQQFDPEYSGVLTPHFFNIFLNKVGIFLTTQQIRTIIELYTKQSKQQINYRWFLEDVKYSISQNIANLLNQAFDRLVEQQGQRQVTLDRLNSLYNADKHPKAVTRTIKPQQSRQTFMKGMIRKSKNGTVSKQSFVDYYAELNFCIPQERQTYFEKILVGTWNLVNQADYVSDKRLKEIELVVYEKIREKSDGKTNQWKAGKKALAYFDLNDNGRCEFDQFKRGLDKFGCVFKDNQISALFRKYDADQSGYLDYEQFSKSIMNMDISGLSSKPNLFTQTMGKNHFTITK